MNLKSGWKTSEFWLAIVSSVVALFVVVGLVEPSNQGTIEGALAAAVTAVFALFANGQIVRDYIAARLELKAGTPKEPTDTPAESGGTPLVLPFLFAAVLVAWAMGGSVQAAEPTTRTAWLPWRERVEQDMRAERERNDRLLELLAQRQQQLAPQAAPAPQIIYLSPPRQDIPLGGPPRQDIPLGGPPKQDIPLGGPPKQDVPIGGPPKQDMPLGGPPRQELEPGPPGAQRQQIPIGEARPVPGPGTVRPEAAPQRFQGSKYTRALYQGGK